MNRLFLIWSIVPDLGTNGDRFASGPVAPGITNIWHGTNVWIRAGTNVATYTVTAWENTFTNCRDTAVFEAVRIELEPVTTAPDDATATPVYNPCAIVQGRTGTFSIRVQPATIPNSEIVWTNMSGRTSPPGPGRVVTSQGLSQGLDRFWVNIADYIGPTPTIGVAVTNATTVNVMAFIICSPTNKATTETRVTNDIARANRIFEQVGMTLQLTPPIRYVTNTAWMTVEKVGGTYPKYYAICNTTNGTGGLEFYFVQEIDGSTRTGMNASKGLILASEANFRAMAHEVGHACGLKDIYDRSGTNAVPTNALVRQSWEPIDWNGGPGPQYYGPSLTQRQLIRRLVMFGYVNDSAADYPTGRIHGVWYESAGGTAVWHVSLDRVGMINMNRSPVHN